MTPERKSELMAVVKNHRWALEELVVDRKMVEANGLLSGDAKSILFYLQERYGNLDAVLGAARNLIIYQKARRKTLV